VADESALSYLQLDSFIKQHRRTSREHFVARFQDPFLLIEGELSEFDDFMTNQEMPALRPRGEDPDKDEGGSGQRLVAHVAKTNRNSFHDLIALGRATSNDIVVAHARVSKFHAYFSRESAGVYTVTDAGSVGGTELDGSKLAEGTQHRLESGATLVLAGSVKATFFLPNDFYSYMK
jgi:hypothetical protein